MKFHGIVVAGPAKFITVRVHHWNQVPGDAGHPLCRSLLHQLNNMTI